MIRLLLCFVSFSLLSLPAWLQAELKLAKLFTDHSVLQQEMPIAVWGSADPAAEVTVEFNAKIQKINADNEGSWRVDLPAMSADAVSHYSAGNVWNSASCLQRGVARRSLDLWRPIEHGS